MREALLAQLEIDGREQALLFKFAATPLAYLYWLLITGRNALFNLGIRRPRRLPGRVVSIGNIETGGTGKTPVTIAIADHLVRAGSSPAILTRGYGTHLGQSDMLVLLGGRVLVATKPGLGLPDEAMLQSVKLPGTPVVVGARRYDAAQFALAFLAEKMPDRLVTHWLLDDGFQHRLLHRDLDIVLLDFDRPYGNGWTLPRGRMREQRTALARADIVLLTGAPAFKEISRRPGISSKTHICSEIPLVMTKPLPAPHHASGSVPPLPSGTAVAIVCGIAKPERFMRGIESFGLVIQRRIVLQDHQTFPNDLFEDWSKTSLPVVTTEKDYWRNQSFFAASAAEVHLVPYQAELPDPFLSSILASLL